MLRRWVYLFPAAVLMVGAACSSSSSVSTPAPTTGAATTSPTAAAGTDVAVTVDQWSVQPDTTTIPAGTVNFDVKNAGTKEHEFVVFQTDTLAADIPIVSFEGEKNRINEDAGGTNLGETGDLDPGSSATLSLDLQPGHYVFFCNLPKHYALGMRIDVTVQ